MNKKQCAALAIKVLKKKYPKTYPFTYTVPLQFLIAARLSARCTDMQVEKVTPALFECYPTVDAFIHATAEEIESFIRPCGMYKTKARDIHSICVKLKKDYNGIVPDTIEELIKLPGVGRKVANLIVGDIFNKPAVVVDTHCIRICKRLGLTDGNNPLKVEKQLLDILPMKESNAFCHRLVLHGRAVCTVRTPKCINCCMQEFCKYAKEVVV